jgi:hypothetical protein
MADLVCNFEGVEYVPVRAIPLMTAGEISTVDLARYLAGHQIGSHIQSYSFDESNRAKPIPPPSWRYYYSEQLSQQASSASLAELISALPADAFVLLSVLNQFFHEERVLRYRMNTLPGDNLESEPGYLAKPMLAPLVQPDLLSIVMEGCNNHAKVKGARKNSREAKQAMLQAAYKMHDDAQYKQTGQRLDPNALTGKKEDFFQELKKYDQKISMATSTFEDHATELGWKWKAGRPPSSGPDQTKRQKTG